MREPKIIRLPHGFFRGSTEDVCPTITTSGFQDNNFVMQPRILTPCRTDVAKELRRQGIEKFANRHLAPRTDGISNCITTITKDNYLMEQQENTVWRIRKLSPRECFRLMDCSDSDINKIQSATIIKTLKSGREKVIPISKSALYKCAGNSIVVSCLYHIFRTMFIPDQPEYKGKAVQRSLFD